MNDLTLPFSGKRALVTGAGRGQGRAIALNFARQGADVAVCDVGTATLDNLGYSLAATEDLASLAKEIEALDRQCVTSICDVRDPDQVQRFVDLAGSSLGGIDIVVNNAGILPDSQASDEVLEDTWHAVIDINLGGPWRVSKACIPYLKSSDSGRIINIASAVGLIGASGFASYCASKHGVVGLTKTMAAELAPFSITVNAVCPGLVDTHMVAHSAERLAIAEGITIDEAYKLLLQPHHIKERITPEQTAATVLYLAGESARVVTGISLPIDGGWTAT